MKWTLYDVNRPGETPVVIEQPKGSQVPPPSVCKLCGNDTFTGPRACYYNESLLFWCSVCRGVHVVTALA